MKAILQTHYGNAETLYVGNVSSPIITERQVLVKTHATALNRADILQREGKYFPPKGESEILGLEMSGEIIDIGKNVNNLKIGQRVAGLLGGGGYAEYIAIDADMVFEIPDYLSYTQAAAIPEVFMTAYDALFTQLNFQKGEHILIHAGASGVGTAAIQLAKLFGATTIFVTASESKYSVCLDLGADVAIDYKKEDFEKIILEETNGNGVNTIIDFLAASYFQQNINCLSMDGRMVILAMLGGYKMRETNIIPILKNRLTIKGATLRNRDLNYKINLTKKIKTVLPFFENGQLKPVVDTVYNWTDVKAAHEWMESNQNIGKIILEIN
jgi:putative PIG3 family NAD(P)H quinone oxidoreductase